MSRRRASWEPAASIETDELLTAMFGEQRRQEHPPVRGCSARCCWPGAVVDAEGRVHRAVWSVLGNRWLMLAAVVALIVARFRGLGW